MNFTVTLECVLIMLAYAVPGYVLVKSKNVPEKSISSFAALLMYVLQPFLTIYSFQQVTYSAELFGQMAIFFLLSAAIQIIPAAVIFFAVRRKAHIPSSRITVITGVAGNVGFMGIPLMNALLPDYPEATAFSAVFFLSMGILSWTVGVACITGDVKYISLKKAFLNPSMLGMVIALPLFLLRISLPDAVLGPVSLLAKMTTPVCMLILGMRFATVKLREIFSERSIYPSALVKLIIVPLLAFAATYFMPVPSGLKAALIIMSACPTANVVLSLSELYGVGQKTAALAVLSSTLFSVVTIPVVLLVLNL